MLYIKFINNEKKHIKTRPMNRQATRTLKLQKNYIYMQKHENKPTESQNPAKYRNQCKII